jgi:hypothetical protein
MWMAWEISAYAADGPRLNAQPSFFVRSSLLLLCALFPVSFSVLAFEISSASLFSPPSPPTHHMHIECPVEPGLAVPATNPVLPRIIASR